MLDSGTEWPGFKSQSRCCRVTVLGKLVTPVTPLFTEQQTGSSPVKSFEGNFRHGGKQWQPTAGFMAHTSLKTDNHISNPPLSFYRPDALPAAQPTASKH